MVSKCSLELFVGKAHVCSAYIVVFPLYTSLVYDRRLEAVSTERAVIHVSVRQLHVLLFVSTSGFLLSCFLSCFLLWQSIICLTLFTQL